MRPDQTKNEIENAMQELQERCLLLDVRTPGEFEEAHIRGSLNVPLDLLEGEIEAIVESAAGRDIALVCRSGQRAQRAKAILAERLRNEMHILEGGVIAWRRAGLPLEERSGSGPIALDRQVRIAAGAMALAGALLALWIHPNFALVPALVGAGLAHSGVTDSCAMGLFLARMPWNRGATCAPR